MDEEAGSGKDILLVSSERPSSAKVPSAECRSGVRGLKTIWAERGGRGYHKQEGSMIGGYLEVVRLLLGFPQQSALKQEASCTEIRRWGWASLAKGESERHLHNASSENFSCKSPFNRVPQWGQEALFAETVLGGEVGGDVHLRTPIR